MKFVIVLGLFALVAVAYSDDFKCVDEVPYKENQCNSCFCSRGELACTLMACISHQNEKLTQCEVGTTWTNDCNTCWCVDRMGTVCEDKKC